MWTVVTILLLFFSSVIQAATLNGKTGDWSSASSWVEGVVPGDGDSVIIGPGSHITLDVSTRKIVLIEIKDGGSLVFSNGLGLGDTEVTLRMICLTITS